MHNKLFIADNRFSISGGRNMAEEYFMRSSEANFIDMDVIAAGPVVREQSQVFDRYWNSSVVYSVQEVVAAMAPAVTDSASVERFDEMVTAAPPEFLPPDERPARPRFGRLRAVGRPHGPALRHSAGLRGHAVQGHVAQSGRHALDREPKRPGGAPEHAVTEEPDHNWLERLKLWLIGPLASEELL